MPDLFGLDIAGIVDQSFASAGGTRNGTLTRDVVGTRDSSNLAGGTQNGTLSWTFRGFLDEFSSSHRNGTFAKESGKIMAIFGASISSTSGGATTAPAPGDVVTLDGLTFYVYEVRSDPAQALFECAVRA